MVASKITFTESECRDRSPKHLQMFKSLLCVAGEETAEKAVHSGSPSGGLREKFLSGPRGEVWPFRPMLLLCPLHAVNGLPPNHQPLKRLEPHLCLASYEGVRRTLIICFEINLVPNFSLISPNLISPITNFTVIQSSHMVVCFFFKLFHTLSGWGGK